MTATPSGGWCLRFLSGAAKGRTLALDRGENIVGSGSDCGVLLAGSDARPRHLIVQVGELAVALQRIGDAPVRLNGDEVTQRRRSLVGGDEIQIGRKHPVRGRAGAGCHPSNASPPPWRPARSAQAQRAAAFAPWAEWLPERTAFVLAALLALAAIALMALPTLLRRRGRNWRWYMQQVLRRSLVRTQRIKEDLHVR